MRWDSWDVRDDGHIRMFIEEALGATCDGCGFDQGVYKLGVGFFKKRRRTCELLLCAECLFEHQAEWARRMNELLNLELLRLRGSS